MLLSFFYLSEIHLGIELSKKPTQRVGCVAKIGEQLRGDLSGLFGFFTHRKQNRQRKGGHK